MSETPKIPKIRGRSSLSLRKRLNKRLSSPQNGIHAGDNSSDMLNSPKATLSTEVKEFTPPHKKLNLDESFDDSPLSFDGCHSPTAFLSQTFGSDSPEVVWRWTQDDIELKGTKDNRKTDSGFSSNNSRTYMDLKVRRTRSEASRQEYWAKREERRRAKELEIRKAEIARVEASLRERLAQLQTQFRGSNKTETMEHRQENKATKIIEKNPTRAEDVFDDFGAVFDESTIDFGDSKPSTNTKNNTIINSIDDFFNDSDDGILVAATQELELAIPELTQSVMHSPKSLTPKKDINTTSSEKIMHQACKDKRSSLYMQFLEDDEDDFFVSLDDAWLQKATQSNNTRSPFQRYKSMPTTTTTSAITSTSSAETNRNMTARNCDNKNIHQNWNNKNCIGNTSKSSSDSRPIKTIKRHASSHAMTSPSTNYSGRQFPSRN